MIDSIDKYKYITGDLDKITIDGEIMPLRKGYTDTDDPNNPGKKILRSKILRGEDITYIMEAYTRIMGSYYTNLHPFSRNVGYYSDMNLGTIADRFGRVGYVEYLKSGGVFPLSEGSLTESDSADVLDLVLNDEYGVVEYSDAPDVSSISTGVLKSDVILSFFKKMQLFTNPMVDCSYEYEYGTPENVNSINPDHPVVTDTTSFAMFSRFRGWYRGEAGSNFEGGSYDVYAKSLTIKNRYPFNNVEEAVGCPCQVIVAFSAHCEKCKYDSQTSDVHETVYSYTRYYAYAAASAATVGNDGSVSVVIGEDEIRDIALRICERNGGYPPLIAAGADYSCYITIRPVEARVVLKDYANSINWWD